MEVNIAYIVKARYISRLSAIAGIIILEELRPWL
ncbi:MAG: hypothetical protein SRB1_00455 [Desulfobacteraceae bacterium Eth-SRB1]|nr:MAG: hypothetical protein SRB1_00455 [Desulfobacteraceae bacterium Eth-SRB1]